MPYEVGQNVRIKSKDELSKMMTPTSRWFENIYITSDMMDACGTEGFIKRREFYDNKTRHAYIISGAISCYWPEGALVLAYPLPFYEKCLVKYDGVDLAVITAVNNNIPQCTILLPESKLGMAESVSWESLQLIEEETNNNFEYLLQQDEVR